MPFKLGNRFGRGARKLKAEDYLDDYSISLGASIGSALQMFSRSNSKNCKMAFKAAREHAKIFTQMHREVPISVMQRLLNVPLGTLNYWRTGEKYDYR